MYFEPASAHEIGPFFHCVSIPRRVQDNHYDVIIPGNSTTIITMGFFLHNHFITNFYHMTLFWAGYMEPQFCPSLTPMHCIKTAEVIIEILLLLCRPIILVFRHQKPLHKSGPFTPSGSQNTTEAAIFNQHAAISRKW